MSRSRSNIFNKTLEHLLDGMIVRQKETIQERETFQQLSLKKDPQVGSGTKGNTTVSKAKC